jgi:hypothetical protein
MADIRIDSDDARLSSDIDARLKINTLTFRERQELNRQRKLRLLTREEALALGYKAEQVEEWFR